MSAKILWGISINHFQRVDSLLKMILYAFVDISNLVAVDVREQFKECVELAGLIVVHPAAVPFHIVVLLTLLHHLRVIVLFRTLIHLILLVFIFIFLSPTSIVKKSSLIRIYSLHHYIKLCALLKVKVEFNPLTSHSDCHYLLRFTTATLFAKILDITKISEYINNIIDTIFFEVSTILFINFHKSL